MAGNSSVTGDQAITFTDNMSFDGTSRGGAMSLDGQLWIGSTASNRANNGGHVRLGTLTAGTGVTITNGPGSITIGLNGSVVGETITGNTGGGLSPVLGNWNIFAAATASGTNPVSTAGSGNTLTVNVQRSQAIAATDATKIGLSAFDSAAFDVDANGFVQLNGGGIATTSFHPNSGTDPVVPTAAGLVNIVGTGSLTVVGSLNTLTPQLTGLTNHAVLVGAGTSTINSGAPLIGATGTVFLGNTGADPGWGSTLAGSFTLSKAVSGSDVSFNVINTSDTASSTANIIAAVAGTSAGDATTQYIVTGTTTWTQGVDNSASDAFVIAASTALGTTNTISIQTTGEINFPLQTSVSAFLGTTASNVTGNNTSVNLGQQTVALTEIFDQNNDFSPGDGSTTPATFTAPVTGRYLVCLSILFQDVIAIATSQTQLISSNRNWTNGNTGTSFTGNMPMNFSAIIDMDAADTLTFRCVVNGVGADTSDVFGAATNPRTFVSVDLIC